MLALIGIGVFAFWVLAVFTWRVLRSAEEGPVERWRRLVGLEDDDWQPAAQAPDREEQVGYAVRRVLGVVQRRVGVRASEEQLGQYQRLLQQAGNPYRLSPEEVAAARVVCALAFPLLALVLTGLQPTPVTPPLLVVATLFGHRFPVFWLQRLAAVRRRQMQRELVNFIDLLTLTAQVKGNLESSIEYVAQKAPGLLAGEFMRALRRARYGAQTLEEALTELGALSELTELQVICNALVQGRRLGVPVAQTLRVQGETLKQSRVHRAEAEAGRATVRLVAPMLLCFFTPAMVILLGPTLAQFVRAMGGR